MTTHKTGLSTQQIKALREPIIRGIDFLEKHKLQVGQNDYKNLFHQYQHILNIYNNMIDRNVIQSKYIDPRTVVQTQPIIDGPTDYDIADWEKQFTANNLNIEPYTIPPINAFRKVKDYNNHYRTQEKNVQMNGGGY
jgi:hemoglobin-like flavoprotein